MFRIGAIKQINVEMGQENIFEIIFDIMIEYPKQIRVPYYPKTDIAKRTLYKSPFDTEYLIDVRKDLKGKWKIYGVYQDIEVLKND